MKVTIDTDLCQGQGRCFSIAPEVFGFDDLGNGVVLETGELSAEQVELARLAEVNCPEHAISLHE